MSNNGKIRVYKNPARQLVEKHEPYVPQYQVLGIEPDEYKSPIPPGQVIAVRKNPHQQDVRRNNQYPVVQPYADIDPNVALPNIGRLPNVGNNMEQSWASVDGIIVDESYNDVIDPNHPMIDNNEFLSEASFGLPNKEILPQLDEQVTPQKKIFIEQASPIKSDNELFNLIHQIDEGEYIILVRGEPVCSGPAEYIKEQTTAIIFGEHDSYKDTPVQVDDVIIVKRVKINVGVFLD